MIARWSRAAPYVSRTGHNRALIAPESGAMEVAQDREAMGPVAAEGVEEDQTLIKAQRGAADLYRQYLTLVECRVGPHGRSCLPPVTLSNASSIRQKTAIWIDHNYRRESRSI